MSNNNFTKESMIFFLLILLLICFFSNYSIQHLTSIGFFDYWHEREYQILTRVRERIIGDSFNRQTIAFELVHLKSLFVIFIIGLLAAAIAFMIEIIWKMIYIFLGYSKE